MDITASPSPRRMPRLPVELRPEKTLTSVTGKRMHLPPRLASSASSSSEQVCTPISRSPWSSFMAILPLAMTLVKSDSRLRRTLPDSVANMTWRSPQQSSSSGSGMRVVMTSPSSSGNRLTNALPRAWGVPSGRR